MGCCEKSQGKRNCVCKVLREISDAQSDIQEICCDTSCDQSIKDLLGETEETNSLDTVPVLLYCQDGCKPFKGFGAHPRRISRVQASFYFRVKKVKKDCCAVIELLRDPSDENKNPKNPVEQRTKNLRATGICMNVDLHCFCHVTCLPAISALN